MRKIKFRCWNGEKMIPLELYQCAYEKEDFVLREPGFKDYDEWIDDTITSVSWPIMQYTGLPDKNGTEIYEGDIFRVEESEEDLIYYLVIVWVNEWSMFCTLNAEEHSNYKVLGIEALDEPMFWTYTLEDTNDVRFFLCGNIYENPELIP